MTHDENDCGWNCRDDGRRSSEAKGMAAPAGQSTGSQSGLVEPSGSAAGTVSSDMRDVARAWLDKQRAGHRRLDDEPARLLTSLTALLNRVAHVRERATTWPTSDEGDTHTRLTRIVDDNLGARPTAPIPALLAVLEAELPKLVAEKRKLEEALGDIGALGDRCEECDPAEAAFATYVTRHPLHGLPIFLCDEHAKETGAQYRKAESKGCGEQPEIEKHEQDTAVEIALRALGEWPTDSSREGETNEATGTKETKR